MTKEELKNKNWVNKLSTEEKKEWTDKLKGENNSAYKNAKKYVITFPNNDEYIINIQAFCKNYKEIKMNGVGLYSCAKGLYETYKGFKCRLATTEDTLNKKEWN